MKGSIRAVEFCKVEDLEYSSLAGSGDSCCKLTLQFVDPSSDVYGKSFKMTLPEVTGFPDFIIERTRYVHSIEKNWTCRDHCKVWWKHDGDDGGEWWDGRVKAKQSKSSEFLDSPWEMYTIQYKSDPSDIQLHSPWELFGLHDSDNQWEQPRIDDQCKKKLHSAFAKLERSADSRQVLRRKNPLFLLIRKLNFDKWLPSAKLFEVLQGFFSILLCTIQDTFGVDKLKQLQQKPKFTNWYIFVLFL